MLCTYLQIAIQDFTLFTAVKKFRRSFGGDFTVPSIVSQLSESHHILFEAPCRLASGLEQRVRNNDVEQTMLIVGGDRQNLRCSFVDVEAGDMHFRDVGEKDGIFEEGDGSWLRNGRPVPRNYSPATNIILH